MQQFGMPSSVRQCTWPKTPCFSDLFLELRTVLVGFLLLPQAEVAMLIGSNPS